MRIEPAIVDGDIEKKALNRKNIRYINSSNQIKWGYELDEYELSSGEWEVAVWNETSRSWGHSEEYFKTTEDTINLLEALDTVDSYDCLFAEPDVDWDEISRMSKEFETRNRTNNYKRNGKSRITRNYNRR